MSGDPTDTRRVNQEASQALRLESPGALDLRFRSLRLASAPAIRASLGNSLERHGQQCPVLASDQVEPGRLVLIDGHERVELLKAAGAEQVRVVVASLDAPSAIVALVAANAPQRPLSDLEEAWVVDTLQREHGLNQVQIAERLGRHKTWVCRRLQLLTRLERQVQEDVRLGLVSVSAVRELARLPRGNQAEVAQAVSRHSLSSRQVAGLVRVLMSVDPEEHAEVLKDPLSHLPPARSEEAEFATDARLSETANRVRQQLLRIHGAANRLNEIFLHRPPGSFSERDATVLGELASPILSGASTQLERIRELVMSGELVDAK
jgi:ParB/RepB/Spo0J family partition protein